MPVPSFKYWVFCHFLFPQNSFSYLPLSLSTSPHLYSLAVTIQDLVMSGRDGIASHVVQLAPATPHKRVTPQETLVQFRALFVCSCATALCVCLVCDGLFMLQRRSGAALRWLTASRFASARECYKVNTQALAHTARRAELQPEKTNTRNTRLY